MFDQKVKYAYLYRDEGSYYLNIRYEVEDDNNIREFHIPRVRIPLENAPLITITPEPLEYDFKTFMYDNKKIISPMCSDAFYLDLKNSILPCMPSTATFTGMKPLENVCYASRIIKDKTAPVEMTMDEIEKQLGHKVKIINKGE